MTKLNIGTLLTLLTLTTACGEGTGTQLELVVQGNTGEPFTGQLVTTGGNGTGLLQVQGTVPAEYEYVTLEEAIGSISIIVTKDLGTTNRLSVQCFENGRLIEAKETQEPFGVVNVCCGNCFSK